MPLKTIRTVSYRSTDSHGQAIPGIFLESKFLPSLGFKLGDKVNVYYCPGRITIEKTIEQTPSA